MRKDRINILGSQVSLYNCRETADRIAEIALQPPHAHAEYVCVSNVHTVTIGYEDAAYAKITNESALSTADGVPLIWASRILNGPPIHGRASGPDILELMIRDSKFLKLKHFFYGGSDSILEKLCTNLRKINPSVQIVGKFASPIRETKSPIQPLDKGEESEMHTIESTCAHIVWIGLGAPKQEIFMYRAHKLMKPCVLIGVGAAFDFLSGTTKRAPHWVQKSGLEWAYRFAQEPRRLANRYLKTNSKFVFQISKAIVERKLGSH